MTLERIKGTGIPISGTAGLREAMHLDQHLAVQVATPDARRDNGITDTDGHRWRPGASMTLK
jgi:hypothetical protein